MLKAAWQRGKALPSTFPYAYLRQCVNPGETTTLQRLSLLSLKMGAIVPAHATSQRKTGRPWYAGAAALSQPLYKHHLTDST